GHAAVPPSAREPPRPHGTGGSRNHNALTALRAAWLTGAQRVRLRRLAGHSNTDLAEPSNARCAQHTRLLDARCRGEPPSRAALPAPCWADRAGNLVPGGPASQPAAYSPPIARAICPATIGLRTGIRVSTTIAA